MEIQRYDYTLEKVKLYTRVPLGMITKITKGHFEMYPRNMLAHGLYDRCLHFVPS